MLRIRWLLILALLLGGCAQATPAVTPTPTPESVAAAPTLAPTALPTVTPAPPTATPETPTPTAPPPTATAEPPTPIPPTATPEPPPGLPPEPQAVSFTAEDGQELEGVYYPGASGLSPMVVLMHWAGGDLRDWGAIAPWLQNRGVAPPPPTGGMPWLDDSWFPPMPEDESYAVFTFTFRGCEGGCRQFDREGWLLDAQAAMRTARGLEGVDPQRVVAVGASLGADGAADGCLLLNQEFPANCRGAFSLSPGSYLGPVYPEVIADLEAVEPLPLTRCAYAVDDVPSARACQAAEGGRYQAIEYPGDDHGMSLVRPDADPPILELLIDFVEEALAEG
jgi:hypothetical protein